MTTTAPEAPPIPPSSTAAGPPRPGPRNVLGLERALVGPALAVAAVVAFFGLLLPWIDAQISDDPAGTDPIDVGLGVTVTPVDGWSLDADDTSLGSDSDGGALTIARSGVLLEVHSGTFDGDARELLDREVAQDERIDGVTTEGTVAAATTDDGVDGWAQDVRGVDRLGRTYAFVHEGVGVVVSAAGPDTAVQEHLQEISDIAASIRFTLDGRPRS